MAVTAIADVLVDTVAARPTPQRKGVSRPLITPLAGLDRGEGLPRLSAPVPERPRSTRPLLPWHERPEGPLLPLALKRSHVSLAHTDADVDFALEVAAEVLEEIARRLAPAVRALVRDERSR